MKSLGVFAFALFALLGSCLAKGSHKVNCDSKQMRVEVMLPEGHSGSKIYLDGMKGYPNPKCEPDMKDTLAEFTLSLQNIYECGVTRVVNKITGKKVYYHKIIIEGDSSTGKEVISVKCIISPPVYYNSTSHQVRRRDVLPIDFTEPEDLEITTSFTENAPEPVLGAYVRQNGNLVSGDLTVTPGTPLQMEIFLDKNSSPVYGLAVTYMEVSDAVGGENSTKHNEETIIFNGCSVDSYLFENFNTVDGDFLAAKFRAFKFPESTFVQFRGTVNVCLDKCRGTECSNGQIGFGRRRRSIQSSPDPNKVFEISLATFIKVNYDPNVEPRAVHEIENKIKQLKIENQKLNRNSRASSETVDQQKTPLESDGKRIAKVEETVLFAREVVDSSAKRPSLHLFVSLLLGVSVRILSRLY